MTSTKILRLEMSSAPREELPSFKPRLGILHGTRQDTQKGGEKFAEEVHRKREGMKGEGRRGKRDCLAKHMKMEAIFKDQSMVA